MKGSKALLNMLADRGVEKIFGYPGGQVIPIFDEILDSSVENVLVRHEQCAAHMADGFSRASGRTGVCLATSGPGATNLVTGVATAYADSVPMMVLTGQVASSVLGMGAFQEVDAFSLMMPVTKYNYRVLELSQLPKAMDVNLPGQDVLDLFMWTSQSIPSIRTSTKGSSPVISMYPMLAAIFPISLQLPNSSVLPGPL